ncbi:MAG: ketopantoate reductase family protein [Anaerolineae bacterium]
MAGQQHPWGFHDLPCPGHRYPRERRAVDFILFCVKTYHTDEAAQAMRPAVGPQTTILNLQNGIDAAERIGAMVGMEHLIGGATWIASNLAAPGVVKQISQFRRIVFGELDGRVTPRIQNIYEVLKNTGITVEISENILKVLWTKFVFIAAISSVGSLTRLPVGDFRSVAETRGLLSGLMREVEALARAQGIDLDKDVVQKSMDFIDQSAPNIKPSMQLDIEAGRRTELESMVGVIGRKGRELGIPTPIADFVYAIRHNLRRLHLYNFRGHRVCLGHGTNQETT